MFTTTPITDTSSRQSGTAAASFSIAKDVGSSETSSSKVNGNSPYSPRAVVARESNTTTNDTDCPSSSSSQTLAASQTSISSLPSSTLSSPTINIAEPCSSIKRTRSHSTGSPLIYAPFNPISKRTVELSESRRARMRSASQPPMSPSTRASGTTGKRRRSSLRREALQHIKEDEPIDFSSPPKSQDMKRGRSLRGASKSKPQQRPQISQRKSTPATLRVSLDTSNNPRGAGIAGSPSQIGKELTKKAAIMAATASAWALKENRSQADSGSDKRVNLRIRAGEGPTFDIIESKYQPPSPPPPSSPIPSSSNPKRVVSQQPQSHPSMSASQTTLVNPGRDWSTGKCSVDENLCLAACCPCIAYARNKSRLVHLEEKDAPHPDVIATSSNISTGKPEVKSFFHPLSWASCFTYTALSPFCLSSFLQAKHKGKTRRRYDLGGGGCSDCATSLFCGPCELARESREIAVEEDNLANAIDRDAGHCIPGSRIAGGKSF